MSRSAKPAPAGKAAQPAQATRATARPAATPSARSAGTPAAKPKAAPRPSAKPVPVSVERIGLFARFMRLFRRDAGPSDAASLLQGAPKSPTARPGSRRPLSRSASDDGAAGMLLALQDVLNRDTRSRGVLPHLRLVEKALERRGLKGLHDVPTEVLRKGLAQLETLVSDWSQVRLAALRAQIKSAMSHASHGGAKPRRAGMAGGPSDLHDSVLEVNEASVSTFMEAHARWERSATGGR